MALSVNHQVKHVYNVTSPHGLGRQDDTHLGPLYRSSLPIELKSHQTRLEKWHFEAGNLW
ncbi:MAG: hypothetical protein FE78DRAFT_90855 [Acidomyces sp. 'richmondensis']|nr:MAG: hypothetical protein FE78DRAFT_90855 [Acidomyces sp. 'richmondensis']